MAQIEISFDKAVEISVKTREANVNRFNYLLSEIDQSNPTFLTYSDFDYYANELSHSDPSGKEWTSNDVRCRMLENSEDISGFDLIDTFGYENDDIIEFY